MLWDHRTRMQEEAVFQGCPQGALEKKRKRGWTPKKAGEMFQEKDSRQSKSRDGEIRSRPGQRGWSPGHTGGHRTEAVTPAQ